MFALVVCLALAQDTVIVLDLDRNVVSVGQKASFTIHTTDSWIPGRWRMLGFLSGNPTALKYDAEPDAPLTTPVIGPEHMGQTFALYVGVFEYGPQFQAETDAVESAINFKLGQRQTKANLLSQYVSSINQADETALDALQFARDQVKAIVEAGQPGAEQAVEDALAAGWASAEAAWAGVQPQLDKWQQLLDEIEQIEIELREIIDAGRTYYANFVQDDAKALKVEFLDKETATCKTVHKLRRELVMIRPQGANDRVEFDALPAGRVKVTKHSVAVRAQADFVTLELEGLAQISAAIRDVEIRALVNSEKIAFMQHTNVEYRNLRLTRQHDVDDSPDGFAYDDAKMVVPDNHLLVYLRGSIFPPVGREIAVRDLIDHLRIDIPVVDDSHAAATIVKPLPRRPYKKNDKKFATIEFAETKIAPANTADKTRLAIYNGGVGTGGGGDFLTVFAYDGLPRLQKDNLGKRTLKIEAISIDGATAQLSTLDVQYFYTFRRNNHPSVPGAGEGNGSSNGLWYYSLEGAGDAATSAVTGWSWANLTVGTAAYTIHKGTSKAGEPLTMGETSGGNKTIQLFGTTIANYSASAQGFFYNFSGTAMIWTLENNLPVKRKVTLTVTVPSKRFSTLVAHVWRHERRHAEQSEKLAKAPGDDTDQDGDLVYNLQEVANHTDIKADATWDKYPVSTSSAKHDQEIDCELRAVNEVGVGTNDWAMDTRTDTKGKNKGTFRLGTQWIEE